MATLKQKRVVKEILENPRKSVSKAMREVGYSPNTAVHPKDLTESKGWDELLEEYLPDEDLTKTHREGLQAKKVISANVFPDGKDGKPINDFIEVPDWQVRMKAVDLGYKVKNKIKDVNINLNVNKKLSDEQKEFEI